MYCLFFFVWHSFHVSLGILQLLFLAAWFARIVVVRAQASWICDGLYGMRSLLGCQLA